MKFVHAADLHIDSPLRGLGAYDGAPVERVRGATRQALRNLVQLCLDERAAFLLLAGDVFDGEWKDFNTGLFFVQQLNRLRDAGTRVYLVRGNHDASSEVTRQLALPDHVHQFADGQAETIVDEVHGVALHGLSFARREMRDSPLPLYPPPLRDALNIGLLHTSAGGHAQHQSYAPCAVDDLVHKGYHYWALGHVHAHDVLARAPWVVFPGNTQGRHIRETGPKGCVVVTVEAGAVTEVRPTPLDVVRWQRVELTLGDDDGIDELYESARQALDRARADASADGGKRLLAARLTVSGATRAHAALRDDRERIEAQLRAFALDGDRDALWLEKIELSTRPAVALDELRASEGFVGELLRELDAARRDPERQTRLLQALQPLVDKLGEELGGAFDMPTLLEAVEARLVAELVTPP